MTKLIDTTLDDIFKSTPLGAITNSIGNVFYGINHRQQAGPVPINKDTYGLTFFTRPQLNLSTQNIRSDRRLTPLLTKEEASIQRIIRCYLDPRLNNNGSVDSAGITCPFVDAQNAFIPVLTNHMISCTNWPDISIDTFTSKPGAYKEVYSQVDSTFEIYWPYDITVTFRNMIADPITYLFYVWTLYQSLVFQGILVPYPDFLVKNEYDYNTRIYRLVLDNTKKYVQKIGCTGASYPTSVPMGAVFNTDNDGHLNQSNRDIQIQFRTMGACYQDDIIIHEFNSVVEIFNPSMRKNKTENNRDILLKKVDVDMLKLFNNRGYPRIDPDSYELEWYVDKGEYTQTIESVARNIKALS